jgi:protocatechuate 3,4-dioxygenase, alpha subunit
MSRRGQTPSQTVGPYFTMILGGHQGENIVAGPDVPGERIRIEGQVFDADAAFIEDALIEVWQANAAGRYRHPEGGLETDRMADGFVGFGRAVTDFKTGVFWIETIKPGRVPDPESELQAPHISVIVQARGMLNPSFTRIYFSDEEEANNADMVLLNVPRDRIHTLMAELVEDRVSVKLYRFDVRFGGDDETVFFDV